MKRVWSVVEKDIPELKQEILPHNRRAKMKDKDIRVHIENVKAHSWVRVVEGK